MSMTAIRIAEARFMEMFFILFCTSELMVQRLPSFSFEAVGRWENSAHQVRDIPLKKQKKSRLRFSLILESKQIELFSGYHHLPRLRDVRRFGSCVENGRSSRILWQEAAR
jgi:hypothetical protein